MLFTALLHVILHFAVELQVLVSQQYANLPSAWQLATALGVDRALYDLDTRMHSALDNIWLRPTRTITFLDEFEWHVQDDVARIIAPDSSLASANVAFTDNYGYFFDTYDAAKPRSGPTARGGGPRKSDVRAVLLLYMLAMATGIALSATHRVNKIPTDAGDNFKRPDMRPSAIAPLQSMPVVSSPAAASSDFQDDIVPEAGPVPEIVDDFQHTERASSPVPGVDILLPTSPSPSTIGLYSEEEDAQPTPEPVCTATSLEDDAVHDDDNTPAHASQDDVYTVLSSDDRAAVQPCSTLLDDAPSSNFRIPAPVASAGPSQSDGDYNWDEVSSTPMETLKDEVLQRVLRFRSESSPVQLPNTEPDLDLDLQDPIVPGAGPIICVVDTAVDKEDQDGPSVSLPPTVDNLLHPTDSHAHHDREVEQPSSFDQGPPTIPSVPLPSEVDELLRSVLSTTDPHAHHDRDVEQPSSSDEATAAASTIVQANDFNLNFIPPPPVPPPPPLDFSFTQWILHDNTSRKDAYVHLRKVEGEEEPNVRRGCRMRTGHRPGVKVVLTPLAPDPNPAPAPKQPDVLNVVVVVRPPVRDLEALGWERRALSEVDGRYDLEAGVGVLEQDADSGMYPYPQLGEEPPSGSCTVEVPATPSRSPTPVLTPEEEDHSSGSAQGGRATTLRATASVLSGTQLERTLQASSLMSTGPGAVGGVLLPPPTATRRTQLLPAAGSSTGLRDSPRPEVSSRSPTPILTPEDDSSGHAQSEGGRARGPTLMPVAGSSTNGHDDSPHVPSRSPTPVLTPEDEDRDDSFRSTQGGRGTALRATVSESNVEAERRALELLVDVRAVQVVTNVALSE